MPEEVHPHSHKAGLRTVATIEALKGVLMMIFATALIIVLRRDVDLQMFAMNLLDHLHVDPDRRFAEIIIDAAGRVMDWNILVVAAATGAYSVLRFVEAYGLWFQRVWAEWLAIVSGAIYLPFEVYELIRQANAVRWAVLIINIFVVAYIVWVRYDDIHARHQAQRRAALEA